jgi:hypothetical protein
MRLKSLALFLLLSASLLAQVQVHSYYRKDGTYVQSYTRRPPSKSSGDADRGYSGRSASGSRDVTTPDTPKPVPNPSKCALVEGHIFCGDHFATPAELDLILAPSQAYHAGAVVERDANGRIKRSTEAKARFKRMKPCPANGSSYGSCPGYVIDHVVPLACGVRGNVQAAGNEAPTI